MTPLMLLGVVAVAALPFLTHQIVVHLYHRYDLHMVVPHVSEVWAFGVYFVSTLAFGSYAAQPGEVLSPSVWVSLAQVWLLVLPLAVIAIYASDEEAQAEIRDYLGSEVDP